MPRILVLTIYTITWLWTKVLCFFNNPPTSHCHHWLKQVTWSEHSQKPQKYNSVQFMPNHANNVPKQNSYSLESQHKCQDTDDQGLPYHDSTQKVKLSHPVLSTLLVVPTSYGIHETSRLLTCLSTRKLMENQVLTTEFLLLTKSKQGFQDLRLSLLNYCLLSKQSGSKV
jgi:hypothetical protein